MFHRHIKTRLLSFIATIFFVKAQLYSARCTYLAQITDFRVHQMAGGDGRIGYFDSIKTNSITKTVK